MFNLVVEKLGEAVSWIYLSWLCWNTPKTM